MILCFFFKFFLLLFVEEVIVALQQEYQTEQINISEGDSQTF